MKGGACLGTDTIVLSGAPASSPTPLISDTTLTLGSCGFANVELKVENWDRVSWYSSATGNDVIEENSNTLNLEELSTDTTVFVSNWDYEGTIESGYLENTLSTNYLVNLGSNYNSTYLLGGSHFTVEALVKIDTLSFTGNQIILETQSNGFDLFVSFPTGFLSGRFFNGAVTQTLNGVTPLVDGNWHHVSFTFGMDTMKLYVDGVLDAQLVGVGTTYASGTGSFCWGGNGASATNCLRGGLDELRIWTLKRSDLEIAENSFKCLSGKERGCCITIDWMGQILMWQMSFMFIQVSYYRIQVFRLVIQVF